MATSQTTTVALEQDPLFTCLSCSIAFRTADEQRVHYKSDHHRYNMKRRVAALPPVSVEAFGAKVMERQAETAVTTSARGTTCDVCRKFYTTENAYRSHINSKKHKEAELKAASSPPIEEVVKPIVVDDVAPAPAALAAPAAPVPTLVVAADATEEEINASIDARIAAARAQLSPNACLFCSNTASSLADSLTHMSSAHGFFVPDAEYLADVGGLVAYLGEKAAIGNACLYCNAEFRSLHAVRKHMIDKSHCKLAYGTEKERMEVSDFYDFSASYPDAEKRKAKKVDSDDDEWEDAGADDEDDDDADEIVDEDATPPESSDEESELDDSANQVTYGDSHLELVLPNGQRLGHRSLSRYYRQHYSTLRAPADPNSGAAIVKRLLADKNSALVPRRGGFGAYGQGTDVVKARNRGEAREAGRHVREHRDQRIKEEYKTRVAFQNNHQKHYRDPLLQ